MDSQRTVTTDVLIIGQGLAGSLLALACERFGIDFLIADNGWKSSSSTAAAGLINPVTGKRLVKTRNLEKLLPAAMETYAELEKELNITLFHHRNMLRLLQRPDDQKQLKKRQLQADYRPLLGNFFESEQLDPQINAPLGAFEQFKTGFVDLPLLLSELKIRFQTDNLLLNFNIDSKQIQPDKSAISINGISARRVVFCEGYKAKDNPWFGYLPFQPDKGEIITFESNSPLPDQIINGGEWLIPIGQNRYRLGSSHEHNELDEQPTDNGRDFLLAALHQLISSKPSIQIIEHKAGVRPATLGTQPFIGQHAQYPQLHIFNGFGAKGSLLTPWYAERFAAFLAHGEPLPEEVNINRFENV